MDLNQNIILFIDSTGSVVSVEQLEAKRPREGTSAGFHLPLLCSKHVPLILLNSGPDQNQN